MRDGCLGPIHAARPTCALLRIMWPDAAYIQEQDAEIATRKRLRRAVAPFYTHEDVQRALDLIEPRPLDEPIAIAEGLHIRYRRSCIT